MGACPRLAWGRARAMLAKEDPGLAVSGDQRLRALAVGGARHQTRPGFGTKGITDSRGPPADDSILRFRLGGGPRATGSCYWAAVSGFRQTRQPVGRCLRSRGLAFRKTEKAREVGRPATCRSTPSDLAVREAASPTVRNATNRRIGRASANDFSCPLAMTYGAGELVPTRHAQISCPDPTRTPRGGRGHGGRRFVRGTALLETCLPVHPPLGGSCSRLLHQWAASSLLPVAGRRAHGSGRLTLTVHCAAWRCAPTTADGGDGDCWAEIRTRKQAMPAVWVGVCRLARSPPFWRCHWRTHHPRTALSAPRGLLALAAVDGA